MTRHSASSAMRTVTTQEQGTVLAQSSSDRGCVLTAVNSEKCIALFHFSTAGTYPGTQEQFLGYFQETGSEFSSSVTVLGPQKSQLWEL